MNLPKTIRRWSGRVLILAAVFLFLFAPSPAPASPITYNLTGLAFPDSISALVIMDYDGFNTLSFEITNTSSVISSLTAFTFNLPSNITGIADASLAEGWEALLSFNAINTPYNLGLFDLAGITKSGFNGGMVKEGIFQGETFTFSFTLEGTGLDLLTTEDFNIFSYAQNDISNIQYIAARFQGIGEDGEDSDVAIDPPTATPIPGAMYLLGSGLLGLAALRRKIN